MRWSWKYNGNEYPELVERKEASIDRRLEEMDHEIVHLREQLETTNRARIAAQKKLDALQSALRPLVLRLKVLDIDAIAEKEVDGGLLPLRFAVSDLKALVAAWDGKQGPASGYQGGYGGYAVDNTTEAPYYGTKWTSNTATVKY